MVAEPFFSYYTNIMKYVWIIFLIVAVGVWLFVGYGRVIGRAMSPYPEQETEKQDKEDTLRPTIFSDMPDNLLEAKADPQKSEALQKKQKQTAEEIREEQKRLMEERRMKYRQHRTNP